MSTDIAIRRQTTSLTNEQLEFISRTEFVPPGLRGNLPAIMACVATGRELGIGDMAALKSIHVIDGKPTFSAELMVQLVRRAGHSITGLVGDGRAVVTGMRADNGDTITVEWTHEMAEKAGLAKKQNWVRYENSMLWARAVSQLSRMLFADCFAGQTYTPEEIEDSVVETPSLEPPDDDDEDWTAPPAEDEPVPEDEPEIEFISTPQRTRLWTIAQANGVDEPRLRELVEYVAGVQSTKEIRRDKYDALVAAVEAESLPFE